MPLILLGPILGIESDTRYSICVLVTTSANWKLKISTSKREVYPDHVEHVLDSYIFIRFSFHLARDFHGNLSYSILDDQQSATNQSGDDSWHVIIRKRKEDMEYCFVSCNGSDKKYPTAVPNKFYGGWQHILNRRPDFLFFIGDQIYSDSIINKIPFLNGSLDNLQNCPIIEIEKYFVQLYIDSWSNKCLATVLATIPNCMTWDDHDIIDGYGSYPQDIQKFLEPIFAVAKKYYHLFQLRCADHNVSLHKTDNEVYNQYIKLRDFHILAPDTRSNRTINQVLSSDQYTWMYSIKSHYRPTEYDQVDNQYVIAILPIPIAHMDFYTAVELVIDWIDKLFSRSFLRMNSDDSIDHWDHKFHKLEQRKILNLLFEIGEYWNIQSLVFLSGDVHCAGASTVIRLGEDKLDDRFATQLITSPIVNKPMLRLLKYFASRRRYLGDNIGYLLKDFGSLKSWLVNRRNYLIIKRRVNSLTSSLYVEEKDNKWPREQDNHRTVNLFKDSSIEESDRKLLLKLRRNITRCQSN